MNVSYELQADAKMSDINSFDSGTYLPKNAKENVFQNL